MKKWEMKMGFNSFFAELHFARGPGMYTTGGAYKHLLGGGTSIRQQGCRVLVIENYSSASVAPV